MHAPVRLYLSAALWPFQVLHISIYNAQRKNEKMNFITACVADFLTLVGKTSGKQRWYPCSGHRRTPRIQYRRWVRISLQPNWPWQIYNVFCFSFFNRLTLAHVQMSLISFVFFFHGCHKGNGRLACESIRFFGDRKYLCGSQAMIQQSPLRLVKQLTGELVRKNRLLFSN